MSHVYVTSDLHIGHTGISEKFRSQFASDVEHDWYILTQIKATVTKRDVLFVLGDATWTTSGLQAMKDADIPARMILCGGNHDTLPVRDYLQVFDEVVGAYRYKHCWFTHIPIHRQELHGRYNVHGHCHRGGPWEVNKEPEYYNAILEFNDYAPINMQQVYRILEERKNSGT